MPGARTVAGSPRAPTAQGLRLGFIGAGRLGTALAWALARAGCTVVAAASRSLPSAERLAAGIAGCQALAAPQAVLACSDLVFLTVTDSAIAPLADSLDWPARIAVVHCSGATGLEALAAARAAGAATGGFHRLQTFADPEAAIGSLPGCTITIEAEGGLAAELERLAAGLGCAVMRLPPGARALYHASGAYASQLINVMLREAALIWQRFGKTEAEAVAALVPLARGTLAAIAERGPAAAMPGPISRGDVATIAQHVAALAAADPQILALYCALSLRAIPLALERGSLDPEKAAALQKLLEAQAVPPAAGA
jgi:predicted short-subunit dehydrogenase-like oxidoreductase (DUF2520 family)